MTRSYIVAFSVPATRNPARSDPALTATTPSSSCMRTSSSTTPRTPFAERSATSIGNPRTAFPRATPCLPSVGTPTAPVRNPDRSPCLRGRRTASLVRLVPPRPASASTGSRPAQSDIYRGGRRIGEIATLADEGAPDGPLYSVLLHTDPIARFRVSSPSELLPASSNA